ncbi:MAG TPA: GNAT family N-acetyltransferase, partial [Actinomycetota bacterium]|nr:GNAT family N-acetyltransferase [Actinomycetota bacterium]
TTAQGRSRGYGLELLRHIEDLARREGCETVALSSGLQRADAHRFYLDKAGFEKVSYTFKKTL